MREAVFRAMLLAAGCLWHGWCRGEREPYMLVAWVILGAIIGATSVFVDRWNTVKISDDSHKKEGSHG